ncbi:MAG TPA: lysophospholipid acyltransferase family protein, partial [Geopsychrobacteraceae bacterium]|nr:lysophospholipid acyltransferase family protein [Geopsychrobacteraceae bacterium]
LLSASIIGFYGSVLNQLKIQGKENIPQSGGTLLASNHISGYDTVLLPWAVLSARPLQMVWAPAKEELFKNRFLGWLFRTWGAFPVRRGRDLRAGKHLGELLQSEKVMLFPEGTRNKDGVLGKGNRGVGKLIYDHRPTVIPTSLLGLNHWKFPGFGQAGRVVFGPPVDFSDLYQKEDCKETHLLIVERLMSAIAEGLKE